MRWPPQHYAKLEIGYSNCLMHICVYKTGYLNSAFKEKWKNVLYIPYFIDTLYIYCLRRKNNSLDGTRFVIVLGSIPTLITLDRC